MLTENQKFWTHCNVWSTKHCCPLYKQIYIGILRTTMKIRVTQWRFKLDQANWSQNLTDFVVFNIILQTFKPKWCIIEIHNNNMKLSRIYFIEPCVLNFPCINLSLTPSKFCFKIWILFAELRHLNRWSFLDLFPIQPNF